MLNPCQEIYESVEKKSTDYYDQQSERIIKAFQRINPQEFVFSPDTEGIPGLQFDELKMAILFEPDYIKRFYEIAKYFGYDERGMIRDSIKHLGMLENPNENEEIIHSLLRLPVIDDISFDSKDTFSIFSEKLGDYHFIVATEALKDNQELIEYLEKVPFANRCYSHALILAGIFEDNYSEVSLCKNIFGSNFHHAYSITPDRKTVIDLTFNGIFTMEDFKRLEEPYPFYSKQQEKLSYDIWYATKNSGLSPDTEWLLQAALYRKYLDEIGYQGPMCEAPKVMQKVTETT